MTATRYRRASHARESAAAIPMISLAFLTTWGQSDASGCRTINHWQLGARKPYGARLFGVFALVQIGFKFPFGERRIGEFGRTARDAPLVARSIKIAARERNSLAARRLDLSRARTARSTPAAP